MCRKIGRRIAAPVIVVGVLALSACGHASQDVPSAGHPKTSVAVTTPAPNGKGVSAPAVVAADTNSPLAKAASAEFGAPAVAALANEMRDFAAEVMANQSVANPTSGVSVAQAVPALPLEGKALQQATAKPTTLLMDKVNDPSNAQVGAEYQGAYSRLLFASHFQPKIYAVDTTRVPGVHAMDVLFTASARVYYTDHGKLTAGNISRDFEVWLVPNTDSASGLHWSVADYQTSDLRYATNTPLDLTPAEQ